jgi:sigma-E factor negative regulatory protein RseB
MGKFGVVSQGAWLRYQSLGWVMSVACCFGGLAAAHAAEATEPVASSGSGVVSPSADIPERSMAQWIERIRNASCSKPYVGTFVVLSSTGGMASSRIWHTCEGRQQVERVEALSGTPRMIFRRNDEVRTFLLQDRTVRLDRREATGPLALTPVVSSKAIGQYYAAQGLGQERVAGRMADVVWFKPLDTLRFGYRMWSERETGLAVKLQTLGFEGQVLEQAAFSELDLNAPVRADQIARMMDSMSGFTVVPTTVVKTTAKAEGWMLRQQVAGFAPVNCHRRAVSAAPDAPSILQCLYSDGLATVSLFLEPLDASHHPDQPQATSMGATHMFAQRIQPDMWLTVVGEVPMQTLRLFAGQWERVR